MISEREKYILQKVFGRNCVFADELERMGIEEEELDYLVRLGYLVKADVGYYDDNWQLLPALMRELEVGFLQTLEKFADKVRLTQGEKNV